METVKNTGSHPIDLDDGRPLAPGETAEDVSIHNAHNKDLMDQGFLTVVGSTLTTPDAELEADQRASATAPGVEPEPEATVVEEEPPPHTSARHRNAEPRS